MQILLADDHRLVRDGLKFYFDRLGPDVDVIEAETFDEALSKASELDGLDLIILDLKMPGMNRLVGLEVMRARFPDVPVVILSGSYHRSDVINALERGAHGFIPKTLSGKAMLNALKLVISGEKYVPAVIFSEAKPGLAGARSGNVAFSDDSPLQRLTPRERDVLALLTKGLSNKEIARGLEVQEVTVKVHLKGVFRKLGASNRTQAVKIAMQLGWEV
ncbi:MAG: response regulator [Alphaproteobacteria bacterium]